jgi:Ca2+:H+ antiporter
VYQFWTHPGAFEPPEADGGERDTPTTALSPWLAVVTIVVTSVAASICSDYLIHSIDDVVAIFGVSKTFIGLVLVPFVGNAGSINS